MSRGKASGISLSHRGTTIVLGMAIRGDRDHDIATWFGGNQGRIAEVNSGSHGPLSAAAAHLHGLVRCECELQPASSSSAEL